MTINRKQNVGTFHVENNVCNGKGQFKGFFNDIHCKICKFAIILNIIFATRNKLKTSEIENPVRNINSNVLLIQEI